MSSDPDVPVAAATWRSSLDRASMVLLIVLFPLHLVLTHLLGDASLWSWPKLAARWSHPGWRVVDWLTISLALVHGLGRLWQRSNSSGRRLVGVMLDVVLIGSLLVVGAAAFSFEVV